jgi:hypothetical protein
MSLPCNTVSIQATDVVFTEKSLVAGVRDEYPYGINIKSDKNEKCKNNRLIILFLACSGSG